MKAFNVDTVYHAAAYKHVPLVENNTVEGVRNNIFGTMYCAQAAIAANVETFVLVSTDKAVQADQYYGRDQAHGRAGVTSALQGAINDALLYGALWQCTGLIRLGGPAI